MSDLPQPARDDTDKRLAFFQGFLREPQQVGSVIPSSRFLEQRLVKVSGAAHAHTLVELGPGTGGTTRALLQAMPAAARLLAIEIDPHFAALLRADLRDPRLHVEQASATDIGALLVRHALPAPDAVISGIPFSTMPEATGRAILRAAWAALAPGGRFVAYQFRDRVAVLGRDFLGEPEVDMELLNVPPVRIYCWRKG